MHPCNFYGHYNYLSISSQLQILTVKMFLFIAGKLPLEEERVEILKLLNQHESIESDFDISFRNSTESDGENNE